MKNKNLIIGLFVLALAGVFVYGNFNESVEGDVLAEVISISPQEFDELAIDPDVFILDVHTPEQKHIAGTDEFIPDTQVVQNLDKLPQDKDTPIIVYCRSGSMSGRVSEKLVGLGFSKVYDLAGGLNAYREFHVNNNNM